MFSDVLMKGIFMKTTTLLIIVLCNLISLTPCFSMQIPEASVQKEIVFGLDNTDPIVLVQSINTMLHEDNITSHNHPAIQTIANALEKSSILACLDAPLGQTPLHIAAANGDDLIVYVLIKAGVNPEQTDSTGKTASQVAKRDSTKKIIVFAITQKEFEGMSF